MRNPSNITHLLFLVCLWLLPPTTTIHAQDTTETTLPAPKTEGKITLEGALQQRRSVRSFAAARLLPLEELGQILWAAQGITDHKHGLRTAPSAGALYPLELYVVAGFVGGLDAGIYRYRPTSHTLERIIEGDKRNIVAKATFGPQLWVGNAPAILVMTGIYNHTAKKYGKRAERYVQIEAGSAVQNIYLQAEAMGLGTTMVGAFYDRKIRNILHAGRNEAPLTLMPIGYPAEATTKIQLH